MNTLDPAITVENLKSWRMLGVTLPEHLEKSLALVATLKSVDLAPDYPPLEDLTPDNIADHLRRVSLEQAVKGAEEVTRVKLQRALALQTLQQASDAVPEIAGELRPGFDQAAESFTAAVKKLPLPLTADALVRCGSDALKAHEKAKQAAETLNVVDQWLGQVASQVPGWGYSGGKASAAIRVATPTGYEQLQTLMKAKGNHQHPQAVRDLHPIAYTAVINDIPLAMNLPDAQSRIIQGLDQEVAA